MGQAPCELARRQPDVVDPETGTPLASEEILTTDPGKLSVRVPAVIGYAVYLAGGNLENVQQRGPRIR